MLLGSDPPARTVTLPDTWAKYDPAQGNPADFRSELAAKHPDFASVFDVSLSENVGGLEILLVAFDREAPSSSPTTFNLFRQQLGSSTEVQAQMVLAERQLSARGNVIVSNDSGLSTAGFPAGRLETRFNDSGVALAGVQYFVMTEPDTAFVMTFITTEGHFPESAAAFQLIAESFHLAGEQEIPG
jgi:hypothetical protein